MHFSNYAVHVPIQADPRFVDKYLTDGLDSLEAAYASLVEGYDESIGELVSFLKDEGVYDNTVIIFVSDNGGLSLAPQRSGESHTQNLPLSVGKGSVYEGGIRVPLLIKKAKGEGRITIDAPVIMEDLFPTILELTNTPAGQLVQKEIDGKSLMPLLDNRVDESWESRPLIWHVPNKWIPEDGPGINFYSAVRQGDYKLIYDMKGSKLHLYNLKEDIGERYDLVGKEKCKTQAMSEVLSRRLKQYKAQMPTYKDSKKLIPYPDELIKN